jgi:8-oxo-dGTP pyrophosphatase MutT (NUDIX family)
MSRMPTMDDLRRVIEGHRPHRLDRTDELKVAAVAAVVRDGGDGVEILLIHRAEDPQDPWSGHMAFPGGRVDDRDAGALAAAIRETREEVALDLEATGILLGRLSDVAAVGRGRPLSLVIEPFVFSVDHDPTLEPNHEVAEIVWVPLDFLLDRRNRSTVPWCHGDLTINLPCYRFEDHVIWGLTFGMVDELVTLLEGGTDGGRWMDPRDEVDS